MRQRPLIAVVFAAIATAQNIPTFRADVSQVHVDVEVLSKDGRIVTGLSQNDFRVFDEGQEQVLAGFVADEQPLDLILLFDTSGSMRSTVGKVVKAANQALHELRRGDRVSVMTFNTSSKQIAPFTQDLDAVERSIQAVLSLRFGGGTVIDQAVDDAANVFLLDGRGQRRRAILIITDNLGTRTRKEPSVIRDLWEADALLSGLLIKNPGYPARRAIVTVMAPWVLARVGGMERIAEKTGGDTIHAEQPDSAFVEMMHRIRNRYSLYYRMPDGNAGSYRSIRVELSPEARNRFLEARVNARHGYRVIQSQ